MAATFSNLLGTGTANPGTAITITTGATAVVGEKIVGRAACFEDLTLTVADSAGNTYTVDRTRTGNLTSFMFSAEVATQLASGGSITLTFSGSASWASAWALTIAGAVSGAGSYLANTGQIINWSTPNQTTLDGSILVGGSAYRCAAVTTSTPSNGTERFDGLKSGNISQVGHTREIATGGTHNLSGTWSDATGNESHAGQLYFAAAGGPLAEGQGVTLVLSQATMRAANY
jgi:hypothetical protein